MILILSKSISPSLVSKILVIRLNSVLFPWPEAPTTAIFLFGSNFTLKLFKIFSSSGYEKVTFLNSITPLILVISLVPKLWSWYNLFSNISFTLDIDTLTLWYVWVRSFI